MYRGDDGARPATSAVTAKRKVVTYRKQASRMASFGAVRYDREPLSNPYQTRDLCPVNLCPIEIGSTSDLPRGQQLGLRSEALSSQVTIPGQHAESPDRRSESRP